MMKKVKSAAQVLSVALLASMLGACATMGGGSPEEIVAKQAQAYWTARIDGEVKTAYLMTAPSYRAKVDQKVFGNKAVKTYAQAARVKEVKCTAEVCEAGMLLTVQLPLASSKDGTIEMYYVDKWVLEDGRWWASLNP